MTYAVLFLYKENVHELMTSNNPIGRGSSRRDLLKAVGVLGAGAVVGIPLGTGAAKAGTNVSTATLFGNNNDPLTLTCEGEDFIPNPSQNGTVTLTTTTNTLTVDVDLVGGLPNFNSPGYTVEIWESNPNCGGDNQYAIPGQYVATDRNGNGSVSISLPYPYTVQSNLSPPRGTGGILGDGLGSETAIVVLDNTQSTGSGDRFRATVPLSDIVPDELFPPLSQQKQVLARRIDTISYTKLLSDEAEVIPILIDYDRNIRAGTITDAQGADVARRMILGETVTDRLLTGVGSATPLTGDDYNLADDTASVFVESVLMLLLSGTTVVQVGDHVVDALRGNRQLRPVIELVESILRDWKVRVMNSIKKTLDVWIGRAVAFAKEVGKRVDLVDGYAESLTSELHKRANILFNKIKSGLLKTGEAVLKAIIDIGRIISETLNGVFLSFVENDDLFREFVPGLVENFFSGLILPDVDTSLGRFHDKADRSKPGSYTGTVDQAAVSTRQTIEEIDGVLQVRTANIANLKLINEFLSIAELVVTLVGFLAVVVTVGVSLSFVLAVEAILGLTIALVALAATGIGIVSLVELRNLHAEGLERIATGGA